MHFLTGSGTLATLLSLTSVIDAVAIEMPQGKAVLRRATAKITSCRGTGQYPIPVNNVCKPCSFKYPGASSCSATAALRCATGFLSAGACVTTCPASTYNNGGTCTSCTSKFPGSATCTSAAATKCNTGFLSAGTCASVCPSGFVNALSTRTCVACQKFDAQAATCSAGKIATCSTGSYLDASKNDCVPCTSVSSFATTCSSSSVITACASPYTVSSDKKTCVLGNSWSYYLSSSIPNVNYDSNVNSPVSCARGAIGKGSQVAVFDVASSTCFSSSSSATAAVPTLVWDAESTVIVFGTCKTNNALIPSAKARCRDITLTSSSCTLADKSACSTLAISCSGSQFINYNGVCQDCSASYPDATTCDLFNGAKTCIDGDYLNNGACSSCSTFDANAGACAANGTVTACNAGWVLSGNACVVDTSAGPATLDNAWSYYPDSSVSGLTILNTNSTDQYDCAEAAYDADLTMASFDPTGNNCYAGNATTALTGAITDVSGASVFVVEICASNQANVPTDQGNTCYDVTIDSSSCTLNGVPCS